MKEKEKKLQLINEIADTTSADQLEITLFSKDYGLTRFAGNQIHQNMTEEDSTISVRVFHNSRLGSCSTNRSDRVSILESVDKALTIAALNDPLPKFPGFTESRPVPALKVSPYYYSTAETDAKDRGDMVSTILSTVKGRGFEAAGAVENGTYLKAVCTNRGQQVHQQETAAKLNLVVNRPGQTGFGTGPARWMGRDISELDCRREALHAVDISEKNIEPAHIDAGEYEVILTPEAVGLLLYYLSWMGFHSRAFHSGQSFMAGHIGEQVLDGKISIWDDGLDCSAYAMPFDWEGVPKKKVELVKDGMAMGVVYDSVTGTAAGGASTGHALSLLRDRYYSSPLPTNLFMKPGEESLGDMISSAKKAVLVHSFWYVREVHWGKATVTGMTRDGTFLVENGKVTRALPNLRFTQSIVEALQNVISVGRDSKLTDQYNGVARVPALKLANFNFVGTS